MTIELLLRRFQTFRDIFLPQKVIGKSDHSQNKTFIRGASLDVSDNLLDKKAIGGEYVMLLLKNGEVCNMEIEIVTLVKKKDSLQQILST